MKITPVVSLAYKGMAGLPIWALVAVVLIAFIVLAIGWHRRNR
ncbi:hypothetical protein ACFV3R_11545 [Streptomyces sp. NPDC059740]